MQSDDGGGEKFAGDLSLRLDLAVILWTWVKHWRTRGQRPQTSGSWRRCKAAHWPGPAAADSATETTPAASSPMWTNGWMSGQKAMMWKWMWADGAKHFWGWEATGARGGSRGGCGVAYLFQTLHVFEVESNVKKAEIRIYKLKLQERRKHAVVKQKTVRPRWNKEMSHLQEPFWWWDFSHRHSGVYSFLWKQEIQQSICYF